MADEWKGEVTHYEVNPYGVIRCAVTACSYPGPYLPTDGKEFWISDNKAEVTCGICLQTLQYWASLAAKSKEAEEWEKQDQERRQKVWAEQADQRRRSYEKAEATRKKTKKAKEEKLDRAWKAARASWERCLCCKKAQPRSQEIGENVCIFCVEKMIQASTEYAHYPEDDEDDLSERLIRFAGFVFRRDKLLAKGLNLPLVAMLWRIRRDAENLHTKWNSQALDRMEFYRNMPVRTIREEEKNVLPRELGIRLKTDMLDHMFTPARLYSGLNFYWRHDSWRPNAPN